MDDERPLGVRMKGFATEVLRRREGIRNVCSPENPGVSPCLCGDFAVQGCSNSYENPMVINDPLSMDH
jgi:hypothetical protein